MVVMEKNIVVARQWEAALNGGSTKDCGGYALCIGGGYVVVIGHCDGEVMEERGDSPESVGEQIVTMPGFDSTHKVLLIACKSGVGSFAGRLHRFLSNRGKRVTIMAPTENTNQPKAYSAMGWMMQPQPGAWTELFGGWMIVA